jgi:release factor glutamine methyltransferase
MRPPVCFATMAWGGVSRAKSVAEAVRKATEAFHAAGVPEPAASAEWLAVSVFRSNGGGRAMIRHDKSEPRVGQLAKFTQLCRLRETKRMPVQYLVGEWDFHHVSLLLRKPVLIPRPETEELVELVLASDLSSDGTERASGGVRVLDVGCGSGAILAALLAAHPTWYGIGLDISEDAVALARENIERVGVKGRCSIEHCSIADWPGIELFYPFAGVDGIVSARRRSKASAAVGQNLPKRSPPRKKLSRANARLLDDEDAELLEEKREDFSRFGSRLFDVIVSNPPYILPDEMESLPPEVREHEDVRALAGGGEDGLDVVRQVLRRAPELVRPGGFVWLEVDPSQPSLISKTNWDGLRYVRTWQDVYGRDRFCQLQLL